MARSRKHRESLELASFLRRMARALVRRAAAGDTYALVALREAREAIAAAEVEAARALYAIRDSNGERVYSWTVIAQELGITRQAARKRFMQEGDDSE